MKRITFLLVPMFYLAIANAQDITDGLRYSSEATSGTARYNALSGAFGALGGDLSAIGVNPAGGAIFLGSNSTFSIAVDDVLNKSTYFNTRTKSGDTDFNVNQAGAAFVFNNPNQSSDWKKFTFAFNYQKTENFDNEILIKGTGSTSIGEFFVDQAQGVPLNLLQLQNGESISYLYGYLGETEGVAAQNAFLGYQGYIIEPIDPTNSQNTTYYSNIAPGAFNHNYSYLSEGANNKFTFNFSTQLTDKFFLGVNFNSNTISYNRSAYLYEANSNPGSIVNQVGFENNLSVRGAGFSAQVGAIMKVHDNLRFGLSFDTPTWNYISEETTQYLETRRIEDGQSILEIINPRVVNVFQDYNLRTPGKITASTAYIFGGQGLLSFDYSYKDFGSIKFETYNYYSYFNTVNSEISQSLRGVSSYKLGGEYRIKQLSLRGGLRYEESPYKDKTTLGDLNAFSLGLGYNLGNYNIDFSYVRAEQDGNSQLYSSELATGANIDTVSSNFALTFGFKF